MIKVAYISTFGTKCGIATYNAELISKLKNHCEFKIFAEHAEKHETDDENVIRCWNRNTANKKDLLKSIKEYNPDIIHISHEYGFFPKAYFFTLLITQLSSYPIVVTFHSVYDHKDKTVQEAMVDNIICHSDNAKQCLMNKGITSNIKVIPHGVKHFLQNFELLEPLWNTWNTQTIIHPGFLFQYKGHVKMLDVIKSLTNDFPDVQYVILGSENDLNKDEHEYIYNSLIQRIKELDLENNVTIKRGFISEEVMFSYIRTGSIVVLPYHPHPDHDVYASSGTARLVLSTCTPLVTSNAHLFDDIKYFVPHSSDNSELEKYIVSYFKNGLSEEEKQLRKQFLEEKSWENIAEKTFLYYKEIIN